MAKWLLVLSSLLSLPALADWRDADYVLRAFELIALNNEYEAQSFPVRKWRQPLKVWLDHRVGDKALHTQLVQLHLAHLAEVTGHPVELVSQKEQANVRVLFTKQASWQAETRALAGAGSENLPFHGAVCLGHLWMTPGYEIRRALVVIPVDQARMHGKLVSCVVEELAQVMGLPNDSTEVFPSVFNDASKDQMLSPLDVTLLRLLYLPQLTPGMQAPAVRRALSDWLTANPDWAAQSLSLTLEAGLRKQLGLR
ncbi:DUF2927 domain-containing protein [Shewanella sp. GXUN23E]|uniref:DUF2927 domain-containing protein n=1 Tax=Shewanella sp. GXUN23E TaxID=3422498 RepID=UPI003D7E87AC